MESRHPKSADELLHSDHYTAEELLLMARKVDRSVSRATVYRTLPLLVECGVLKEMDFGKDYKFYDPNYIEHPHHNHLGPVATRRRACGHSQTG